MILNNFVSIGGCFNVNDRSIQVPADCIEVLCVTVLCILITHIFHGRTRGTARNLFWPVNCQRGESVLIWALLPILFNNISTANLKTSSTINSIKKIFLNFYFTIPISIPKHQLFSANLQQYQEQKFYEHGFC